MGRENFCWNQQKFELHEFEIDRADCITITMEPASL